MSDAVLKTENLGISFGGLKAVQELNLEIKKGQLYGLVGPNGAGKTTVFNMITGVYKPTTGKFWLDGENLTGKSQETINHRGIARTFQNIRLFNNMTVIRNVMVGLHNQPEFKCGIFSSMFRLPAHFKTEKAMRKRAKEILEIVGLFEERNNLSCNLPYGKQRKLEIARALATSPKLLCLDEPAAGMNPQETADLMDIVRCIRDKYNVTILLIEHDMKFVSGLCDEITVLNFGTVLAQGVKRGLMSNEAGQGTITMSAASADAKHPCEQGILAAIGVFLDTIVICTLSGFVVVMAHCWTGDGAAEWALMDKLPKFNASLAALTPGTSFNAIVTFIITLCFCMFAYTCLLGMISFSEIAANRIKQSKGFINGVRIIAIAVATFGIRCNIAGLELGNLWAFSDLGNILIVFFNVPIVYVGAKYVFQATEHFKRNDGTAFTSRVIGRDDCEYWDEKADE